MNPVKTSACNVTFVAEGCADLPAMRAEEAGFPTVSTYWMPDKEELAMLAAGYPVKLTTIGPRPQPVRLEVDSL